MRGSRMEGRLGGGGGVPGKFETIKVPHYTVTYTF